jgi:hypothetical protein
MPSTNLTFRRMPMPEINETTQSPMTPGTSQWLDDHLETVKSKILTEASRYANRDGSIEPRHIAEAAKLFAPGFEVPREPLIVRTGIVQGIFSWTPSITTVSALLAIAFGVIGWRAPSPSAFDIAKVFAGAIVGSAGVAVKSSIK